MTDNQAARRGKATRFGFGLISCTGPGTLIVLGELVSCWRKDGWPSYWVAGDPAGAGG